MGKKIIRIVFRVLAVMALIAGGYCAYNLVAAMDAGRHFTLFEWMSGIAGTTSTLILIVSGVVALRSWAKESP